MKAAYERMSTQFGAQGLDMGAVESMAPWWVRSTAGAGRLQGTLPQGHDGTWETPGSAVGACRPPPPAHAPRVHRYHNLDASASPPWPKRYEHVHPPLPDQAVRLLVLPLECCPLLASAGAAAAAEVARLLPPGTKVFLNAQPNFHCTIFHTSHPADVFNAAVASASSSSSAGSTAAAGARPPPAATAPQLQRELEGVAACVAAAAPPRLRFERLVMAPTGVLLMT